MISGSEAADPQVKAFEAFLAARDAWKEIHQMNERGV
jgi:hypothetical protein